MVLPEAIQSVSLASFNVGSTLGKVSTTFTAMVVSHVGKESLVICLWPTWSRY